MTVTGEDSVYEYAKYYMESGLSVIPLKLGSKEPLVAWKQYQERLPSPSELEEWFKGRSANIAIVTGRVSGNLVVLDFDSKESFKAFVEKLKSASRLLRIDVNNTWIVETGKGYHVYLRLPREDLVPRTKVRLVEGVDLKAEGGYVVAPPSMHPSGKRYRFIEVDGELLGPPSIPEPVELREEEWQELLRLLAPPETGKASKRPVEAATSFKELGDNELLRLKEILKEAWVEGQRQFLALFMSGWLAKARIHPVSTAKLFRLLAEERGDNELEERLSTIYYSYKKLYGAIPELEELDRIIEEWKVQGVLRRNVSRAISKELEERVKGKTGVQEILENTLGEERALEAVREIEEILGTASPFKDSVIEILDYDKQLYAVANLRKHVVVRARRDGNRLVYKERVTVGAPTRVTVYVNPLGGLTKYEVVWEARTRPRPLVIGPAPIEDVVDRLKAEGLVLNHRLVRDVINAIIEAYLRKGRAEIREEIEAPGFYWVDGRLVVVRWEPREVSSEELREALELLGELASEWFSHAVDKFSTIVKWGIIAPFTYAMKQRGRWVPWLILYGASRTGKTTLGEIVLHIWGLDNRYRKTGANIDTVPRLGHVLSQSTFPTLVNEPGAAIAREDVVETLKNAVETTIARGRYVRGSYTEIPSLSPLIMTSNKVLPRDDALLRRFMVIRFTYGERIDSERAREFDERVKPRLKKLEALGHWVAKKILEDPELLDKEWLSLAEELLGQAYREAGLEPPEWIKARYEAREDIYEELRETIREYLIEQINSAYFRAVGKVIVESVDGTRYDYRDPVDAALEERVRIVLEKGLLPWAAPKGDSVVFTAGFARELAKVIGDIGGLKSIAELLGWEYKAVRLSHGGVVKGIMVSLDKLIEFLSA